LPIENATCIEWLGGQRWVKGLFDQDTMKKIARLHGGHVTLFRGDKSEVSSAFTSLKDATITAPLATVQERIRKTFDPYGIFQTNRMP
jgi:glycolate oxidase FAD binding subunit